MLFSAVVMERVKLGNFSVNYALKKLNHLLKKLIGTEELGRKKIKQIVNECFIIMRMSKLLIIFGAILILVGLLYPYLSRIGLGKLPGDIQFKMGDSFFYFPITTSIVLSIFLTLILRFFIK